MKLQIPVAHIESGLRSFDRAMPEEHNRRLTDHVSDVLLAHSPEALVNLEHEGIPAERVHLVGNTMIDSLLAHVEAAKEARPWEELGVEPGGYGLVTLHRPSLVDDPGLLERTVEQLIELARAFPVVFPVHPRTLGHIAVARDRRRPGASGVTTTEPLGYLAFLGLQAEARFVLTDSGGIQEETSALGVRCFTLRASTERPITIERGTNLLLGARPSGSPRSRLCWNTGAASSRSRSGTAAPESAPPPFSRASCARAPRARTRRAGRPSDVRHRRRPRVRAQRLPGHGRARDADARDRPHRGPDGGANWIDDDGRIGLGFRRLAIIDLSEAAMQPMANEDGRVRLVFNGEIYNHAELRRELEATGGHTFGPTTATPR